MSLLRSTLRTFVLAKSFNGISQHVTAQSRHIKRWVAPTLRELKKRADKLGLANQSNPRSSHIEWNYRAELFAFGKRLNEEFQMPLLQTAFTQSSYITQVEERQRQLGVDVSDLNMTANNALAERGAHIMAQYIDAFLEYSLPAVPAEGKKAFAQWLQSTETLSNIALHLGMKELILTQEYPPNDETLAKTLSAVIGALADSSSMQRAFLFVRDFVCTQLNQKDLTELWHIEQPMAMLTAICAQQKHGEPEPRLIGMCGKNTVLAAYEVGIYADKKLLGKGFGENVNIATDTAALDALAKFFGIGDSMRPFDFQLQVEPKHMKLAQA